MTRYILAALLLACSAPVDEHTLRQATKELCEFRHDCLGIERDYPQCEADATTCGVDVVLSCFPGDCTEVVSCLEAECGRGTGLGLEP